MLPREKFIKRGINALTENDLISIIISKGIKGRDYRKISIEVYSKLKEIINEKRELDIGYINSILGVGDVKAMQLISGIELGRRLYQKLDNRVARILNSNQLYELLSKESRYRQERMIGIYLNSRYELISKKIIAIGNIDNVSIDIREIITYALEFNACYVAISHNHPSGDTTPSVEDIRFTKRLNRALDLMNINFLEHLIIGVNGWTRVDI